MRPLLALMYFDDMKKGQVKGKGGKERACKSKGK
jgi:hypothetical protein